MPIEIKVLAFGDFLFFMHLKVKEILMPYLVGFYDNRINLIKNFMMAAKDLVLEKPHNFEPFSKIVKLENLYSVKDKAKL